VSNSWYKVNNFSNLEELLILIWLLKLWKRGPGSSVSIATGYGLDGPGIESRLGRDFPHLSRSALGPTQPPVQWVPVFPGGRKRPGRDANPSPLLVPRSKTEWSYILLSLRVFTACKKGETYLTVKTVIRINWEGTSRWREAVTRANVSTLKELLCKVHASHYPIVNKLEMKGLHETWNHFNCRNGVWGPACIRSARVWSLKLHSKPTNRCIYIHLSFCSQRCRSLLSISKRSNCVLLRIYSLSVKTLLHTAVQV
jgi:hypothetical protein